MLSLHDPTAEETEALDATLASLPGFDRFDDWRSEEPLVVGIYREDTRDDLLTCILEGRPHVKCDSDPGYTQGGIYLLEPYLLSWVEFLLKRSSAQGVAGIMDKGFSPLTSREFAEVMGVLWRPTLESTWEWTPDRVEQVMQFDDYYAWDAYRDLMSASTQRQIPLVSLLDLFDQFRSNDPEPAGYRYDEYAESAILILA